MPEFLSFMSAMFNEGDAYEKIPRFIPYAALPIGLALMTFRFLQLAWKIHTGEINKIIASHEVEDDLEAVKEAYEKNMAMDDFPKELK
jgi:C4-dicarboxylate transporter DctQ subunit